ncbi:MAG: Translation initiation factor IF-1 [Candidatus Woesebacteria bacterium GW2011_GWA1_41_13b]|uniref:Translation initiation factor IF-1 n=1 Tax=Candidatus Woesebacteria bacterium GW2011_GWA1_41_13b TaxID=1618555 RepID=A0A0G0UTD9_9BACT|nr:MAG: Translation initiation factor IF-1 [Candidatus Woesebacteria bacterium GW2011_GWA1_41_13b]
MPSSLPFEFDGVIIENLPNTSFRVRLAASEKIVLCHLAGKMRIHWIRLLPGDKVRVAMASSEETLGRIILKIK